MKTITELTLLKLNHHVSALFTWNVDSLHYTLVLSLSM